MAKVSIGIRLDERLVDRLHNAIWHLGQGMTITSVANEAIKTAVTRLEKRNGGKPFPQRVIKPRAPEAPETK